MSDKTPFTLVFFQWAADHGIKSNDIAKELGKSRINISNWRSKSLPKGQEYACRSFMEKVARGKNILSVETAQEAMQVKLDGITGLLSLSEKPEAHKLKMAFIAGLDAGAELGVKSMTITAKAIVGFGEEGE